MPLPVKGEAYIFTVSLVDNNNPQEFLANPTIAAGDFQITVDGSVFANLAALPTVTPAGDIIVRVSLSAVEMDGSKVTIKGIDQTVPKDWQDVSIFIDVPDASTETLFDVDEGDRTESNVRLTIKQKGTDTVLIDKEITGSLLDNEITLRTTDIGVTGAPFSDGFSDGFDSEE